MYQALFQEFINVKSSHPQHDYELGTSVIPVLQMRMPRDEEVE